MTAFIMALVLFGCLNEPNYTIDDVENDIAIVYASEDDQTHVTQDVTLPHTSSFYSEAFITWQSSHPTIITHTGQVTRDLYDHDVTLVYSISYHGQARIGSIVVTVLADRPSIDEIAADVDITYASGDSQNSVTQNVTLPTISGLDSNASITWSSSNANVMSNDGVVTRSISDELVTMTFVITYHDETKSGSIFLVVLGSNQYYSVTFESNGGTEIDEQSIIKNATVVEPEDPTKEGYHFVAWYVDESLHTIYDFNTIVNQDLTLYAKWQLENQFVYTGYYASINGLQGNTLFLELRSIIQFDMIKISYGDARYILDESDRDPENSSHILTVYDRVSVSGVWDAGGTWDREHVWPNSRLGIERVNNNSKNIGSDLFNLRPSIPSTNRARSNKWYDLTTTNNTYFPGEDDKGDVARILLYMITMYPQLNLVEVITSIMDSSTYELAGAYMAVKSVILQWHIEDPVDDFERNRNEVIYSYQNNRNPYVDHPELVGFIWD